jgi:hypothetical protein
MEIERDDAEQRVADGDARAGPKLKPPPRTCPHFEFVFMTTGGVLDSAGISQIRAHTTRELHETRRRRKTDQVRTVRASFPARPAGSFQFFGG